MADAIEICEECGRAPVSFHGPDPVEYAIAELRHLGPIPAGLVPTVALCERCYAEAIQGI